MEEINMNKLPEKIKRFMKTIKQGTLHNIYHFQSIDKNGNVTAEAYGKNLLTDYGLSVITTNSNNTYFYISTSQTAPTLSNSTLTDLFTTSNATVSGSTILYDIEYDKDLHVASQTKFHKQAYWDYNYDGITTDVDIYSIGIYDSSYTSYPNRMVFHSLIYDENGDPTHITKRTDERLYVSVYITAMMNVDVIDDIESRNNMAIMISPEYLFGGANTFSVAPITATDTDLSSSYYNYAAILSGLMSFSGQPTDHVLTMSRTATAERTYESGFDSLVGVRMMSSRYMCGYKFNMQLSEPETLVTEYAQVDDYGTDVIDAMFGGSASQNNYTINPSNIKECVLPVSDFTITDLKRYNYSTHAWDTDVLYNQASTRKVELDLEGNATQTRSVATGVLVNRTYNVGRIPLGTNEGPLRVGYPGVTFYGNNGLTVPGGVIVYRNPHTEFEIEKIVNKNAQAGRWAMTDNYLDISSYEEIDDLNNLSKTARTKKYLVQLGGTYVSLVEFYYSESPIKSYSSLGYQKNKINIDRDTVEIDSLLDGKTLNGYNEALLESDTNSWIAFSSCVVFSPEDPAERKVLDLYTADKSAVSSGELFGNDDYVVKFVSDSIYRYDTVRIYDVSDPTVVSLPYNDVTFTTGTYSSISASSSKYGYICAYDYNNGINTAHVIEYASATPSVIFEVTTDLCMLGENSKYFVYHDITVPGRTEFVVYDCTTTSEAGRFYFPTNVTYTLTGIFVWKEHVYIQYTDSNSTSNTYYYRIDTGQLVSVNNTFGILTKWKDQPINTTNDEGYRRYSSTDTVCVLSTYAAHDTAIRIITLDTLTTFGSEITGITPDNFYARQYTSPHLKYTLDGKTLILGGKYYFRDNWTVAGASACDLGAIIDGGFIQCRPYGASDIFANNTSFAIPYKDYVAIVKTNNPRYFRLYPFERFIKLKMTGTTNTISSYNNPFRIDYGMTFTGSITNNMNLSLHEIDTNNDKVNVIDYRTNEVTQFSSQSDAASFLRSTYASDPTRKFNVYLGDNFSDSTLIAYSGIQNLVEFRTNSSIHGFASAAFAASSIKRFVVHPDTTYIESQSGVFSQSKLEEFIISDSTQFRSGSTGGMFANSQLKSIHIGNTNTLFATGEFAACTKLESVYVDYRNVGYPCSIGKQAFAACNNLRNLQLVSFDGDRMDEVGEEAFAGTGIPEIDIWAISIGEEAFAVGDLPMKTTTSVTIRGNGIDSIGKLAFNGNTNLKHITLDSVDESIASDAFLNIPEYCVDIDINESYTTISTNAPWGDPDSAGVFYRRDANLVIYGTGVVNTGLYENNRDCTTITFRETPSGINAAAFAGCINVTDIYVPWASGDIDGAPWGATNATVHYGQANR